MYSTVVTICTDSGHYMYRQWSLCVPPAVNICTASGHYMYRTVVTLRTASGHYMYRQRSLYVPPVVTMYRTVVTICTASGHYMYRQFNSQQFFVLPTQCICFLWIWEQTAIISLHNINWLVCITETESVYCAVRTGSLYIIQVMCFVWIWEQTAIISLYSINWLVCITDGECLLRGTDWIFICSSDYLRP